MEIRMWCFVILVVAAICFGYVSDLCEGGIRIYINSFFIKFLFLKNDGRKKQLIAVVYQIYIEGLVIFYLIKIFIYKQFYNFYFRDVFRYMAYGIIILFVYEGVAFFNIKLRRFYRGGKKD